MIYVYENAAGERREVVASMKSPPPECIGIENPDDPTSFWVDWMSTVPKGIPGAWDERKKFRRVYGESISVAVPKGEGVHHPGQKIPCSESLPDDPRVGKPDVLYGQQVRRHEDGTYSSLDWRPICHNADAMKRHTERTGHTWVR